MTYIHIKGKQLTGVEKKSTCRCAEIVRAPVLFFYFKKIRNFEVYFKKSEI
jgi:hypothetical protein